MYKKLLAGLGGAIVLNVIHEVIRKNFSGVPEINKVAEEGAAKALDKANVHFKNDKQSYATALTGDIIANTLYYSNTATNYNILSGLVAGAGTIILPKYLGLSSEPVASTNRKKLLTVAYYTLGAIATKIIYSKLNKHSIS